MLHDKGADCANIGARYMDARANDTANGKPSQCRSRKIGRLDISGEKLDCGDGKVEACC